MWGPPERVIFCIRQPDTYINSAVRKFAATPLVSLQQAYINVFARYPDIAGDIFEYGPELTLEDYRAFLQPLRLGEKLEPFTHKGVPAPEQTTPEMWAAYDEFRRTHRVFPR